MNGANDAIGIDDGAGAYPGLRFACAVCQDVHAHEVDPGGGDWTLNEDGLADGEAGGVGDGDGVSAGGHEGVGDGLRCSGGCP